MRWKVSAPRKILASLPSFCQKVLKLVEIRQSSDTHKNNFAQVFETRCSLLFECIGHDDIFVVQTTVF